VRKKHAMLISAFFIFYLLTFLPNFGKMNELKFIGFLPQSLAWVLLMNAINTVIIFIVYFKFFKPFAHKIEKMGQEEKGSEKT